MSEQMGLPNDCNNVNCFVLLYFILLCVAWPADPLRNYNYNKFLKSQSHKTNRSSGIVGRAEVKICLMLLLLIKHVWLCLPDCIIIAVIAIIGIPASACRTAVEY